MASCCRSFKHKRKTARAQILIASLPILIAGLLTLYAISMVFSFWMFVEEFNNTIAHFLKLKEGQLARKAHASAINKQRILQEPLNNNEVFKAFLEETMQGRIPISSHFNIETISLPYTEVPTDSRDLDYSYWFIDNVTTSYETLSEEERQRIKFLTPLFPIWKSFLRDDLLSEESFFNTIYYATEEKRLFFRYPTVGSGTFTNWSRTEDPCEYFESGKMDFYDARCRHWYRQMKDNLYNPTIFGPYLGPTPSNAFYALTLAQGIENNGSLHGSFGHDINLNFAERYDWNFGTKGPNTHYFMTYFDGTILKHSNVTLDQESQSLTKAEFSTSNTSLSEELFNGETEEFNKTFLPIFKSSHSTEIVRYSKYGKRYLAVVYPLKVSFNSSKENPQRVFIYTQVTSEEYIISIIKDESTLIRSLIIWGILFTGFFIFILVISICILSKIASRALRPIKLLNNKVTILNNTPGTKTLENAKSKMTSYESILLFQVFTDLIPAVKFANNNIDNSNDALSIMEYAEAYTVFQGNKKVQGICMTNIGHHYFNLKDYQKASRSYEEAAQCAHDLMIIGDSGSTNIEENIKPFCKRTYYASIAKFFYLKNFKGTATEEEILTVRDELKKAEGIIIEYLTDCIDDLLIMLNLYSSKCLLMTRRLISAENDLKSAMEIYRWRRPTDQQDRPEIPVIPRCILKQRLILQKALVMIDFKKIKPACLLMTKLLKSGKVYDPTTRKEALKTLHFLLTEHLGRKCFQEYPETQNIGKMIQAFHTKRKKNIVLIVDSNNDDYFLTKKNLCCEIFDSLESEDNMALLSLSKNVKRIFSFAPKEQNTIQLNNQLKGLGSSDFKKLLLFRGIQYGVEEITKNKNSSQIQNQQWIICIVSTTKFSRSYTSEQWAKLEQKMKEKNINILLICVGNPSDKDFSKLQKHSNFNDSTVFLNFTRFYNKRERMNGSTIALFGTKMVRIVSPTPEVERLRSLMSNISNIRVSEDKLIYEKF
ncbi:unnamed protein product [Moneuplotes crassus]|uniref:VWFA domain-containing protein n=1 Tax=Euplotes crassus TaxID=5936 RepID=A0AAD1XY71_EUPCR|nr:unnamed protein product [Moneuplotes crassus]